MRIALVVIAHFAILASAIMDVLATLLICFHARIALVVVVDELKKIPSFAVTYSRNTLSKMKNTCPFSSPTTLPG